MTNSEKSQAVINTLEQLTIPATYSNVSKMLGVYNTMVEIRDDLRAKEEEAQEDEKGQAE